MVNDLIVTRSTLLNTHAARVWEILTDPKYTKHYTFNCEVCSSWQKGSEITWKGEHDGKPIHQKGEVLEYVPGRVLAYSTFDVRSGAEDNPVNYIHVHYKITPKNGSTELLTTLSNFGGNTVRAENAAYNWDFFVLPKLKELAEQSEFETVRLL
jgi:uncharacterized protein YndB with AHSA1/START domain